MLRKLAKKVRGPRREDEDPSSTQTARREANGRPGSTVQSNTGATILVIGDSHAKPDQCLERFAMAGEFANHIDADIVVSIGDTADMESLSSYDKGKRSFEGRRYDADVESCREALRLFRKGLDGHGCELYVTHGNHDDGRIRRVTQEHPELHGTISVSDLGFAEAGWNEVPFLDPLTLHGVTFCHYFASGVMGRAIGGATPARMLLNKLHIPVVVGHGHLFDTYSVTTPVGTKLRAAMAGCFFEHQEDYAGRQVNQMWDRGLMVMRDVRNGQWDPEWWGMDRLKSGRW